MINSIWREKKRKTYLGGGITEEELHEIGQAKEDKLKALEWVHVWLKEENDNLKANFDESKANS